MRGLAVRGTYVCFDSRGSVGTFVVTSSVNERNADPISFIRFRLGLAGYRYHKKLR